MRGKRRLFHKFESKADPPDLELGIDVIEAKDGGTELLRLAVLLEAEHVEQVGELLVDRELRRRAFVTGLPPAHVHDGPHPSRLGHHAQVREPKFAVLQRRRGLGGVQRRVHCRGELGHRRRLHLLPERLPEIEDPVFVHPSLSGVKVRPDQRGNHAVKQPEPHGALECVVTRLRVQQAGTPCP